MMIRGLRFRCKAIDVGDRVREAGKRVLLAKVYGSRCPLGKAHVENAFFRTNRSSAAVCEAVRQAEYV